MLELSGVCKRLKGFSLENVSVELPSGCILGLVGENGAGKTTLLRVVSGLYTADAGRMALDGLDPAADEAGYKEKLGVVFHGEMFEPRDTLLGNAQRFGAFYQGYDGRLFLEYALRFSLDVKRKYRKLSKGEQLKYAFAFALSHRPRLLLLDEPAASFDYDFRRDFFAILREFVADGEHTVVLSTHLPEDIDRVADYLLFLEHGRQLVFDDIEGIRSDYRMVAGEAYKLRLLKERIVHMEAADIAQGGVSAASRALVRHSGRGYDRALTVWEPTMEEFMYFMVKRGQDGHGTKA